MWLNKSVITINTMLQLIYIYIYIYIKVLCTNSNAAFHLWQYTLFCLQSTHFLSNHGTIHRIGKIGNTNTPVTASVQNKIMENLIWIVSNLCQPIMNWSQLSTFYFIIFFGIADYMMWTHLFFLINHFVSSRISTDILL